MRSVALSISAGVGTYWLYTATVFGWRHVGGSRPLTGARRVQLNLDIWLRQAGLEAVNSREFGAVIAALFTVGGLLGLFIFGGLGPAILIAGFSAWLPIASYRHKRQARRDRAQEAWPRMIEEIRIQTGSLGRAIPQALIEVGRRGPVEMGQAFAAAHREWLLTTDLARTTTVLKRQLADPTADMACETLLVAHEVGGADLDGRLEALAKDRSDDVQGRKDARSRQAGARFARFFVLLVPGGMALAGMSIGNGRAAYRSSAGQVAVVFALALIAVCWVWAGRVMQIPATRRVFDQ